MNRFDSASWPLKAIVVAGLAVSATALASGLALTIALAGLHQLPGRIDVTAVPGWLWYFRGDPQVQRWLKIGGLSVGGLTLVGAIGVAQALRRPLHGAARWASESDVRRAGLRAEKGLVLGRKDGRPLVLGGPEHVLLYAPTRTGKGVGVVIPNLLTWPDSVVVLDVKRENWDATAGFRKAYGQEVHLFDPLDPEGRTARFNPLDHINRSDPIEVLDELQRIAVMLLPIPVHTDPFWAEAARTGFVAFGAYVAETPELPFSIGAIHAELTRGDPRERLPKLIAERDASGRPLSPGAVRALNDFCASSENTFASIRQTLTSRLNLWHNPRVRAATDTSDFDLRTLRQRRQSIYLATGPDNLTRIAPLYALLFQQLIDLNTRERPEPGRATIEVLVLLDEFARLGHAGVLAHAFAYVAGYGLRLLPVLQSPSQLRHEYGPDLAQEIVANCGVEIVFAPKENALANELSERLGYTTVRSPSRSRPSGLARGHRSVSESEQRRALMLPQELMQLPPSDLIVLKAGLAPVRGRKIVYYRESVFARRLQAPPVVPPRAPEALDDTGEAQAPTDSGTDPLTLAWITPALEAAGLEPIPPEGATPEAVEAWVERFIDASAQPVPVEIDHAR